MTHILTVVVVLLVLAAVCGVLVVMARRAWRATYGGPLRPLNARQIANQQAAEAYDAHHPQVRSARFVRRRTYHD